MATGARSKTAQKERQVDQHSVQNMFLELQRGIASINTKMDAQADRLEGMQQAIDSIKLKGADVEERVTALEQQNRAMAATQQTQAHTIRELKAKTDDLEGRSRRNNLRILGIPESETPPNMSVFIEELLIDLFGKGALSEFFVVERAHRTMAPRPPPGALPRPVLAKLLNYKDRDAVLRLAREKGKLQSGGADIAIYPDFALSVQNARRAFNACKQTLRAHEVVYSMMFPAKLRMVWHEKTHFFTDPALAAEFIAKNIGPIADEERGRPLHPKSNKAQQQRRKSRRRMQRPEGGRRSPFREESDSTTERLSVRQNDSTDSESVLQNNG